MSTATSQEREEIVIAERQRIVGVLREACAETLKFIKELEASGGSRETLAFHRGIYLALDMSASKLLGKKK